MGHARWYQGLLDENLRLRTENGDLKEENRRLKAEIARPRKEKDEEARTAKEKPFGNDTPSSKVNFKPSADDESARRNGGGVRGHDGHGRRAVTAGEADEAATLKRPEACRVCGGALADFGAGERTVRVAVPAHYRTLHHTVMRGWCPVCRREETAGIPGALPKFAASNSLLAQNVMDRFVYGMTAGAISARTGLGKSTVLAPDAAPARILKPCEDRLAELYRPAFAKGADETGWRCDGVNGYVYGFFTADIAPFRFKGTRKKWVAEEVFGKGPHFGVLVRDRYAAYDNSFGGRQQYCLGHLKRDCLDLMEKEPGNKEYLAFVPAFAALLREALALNRRAESDGEYCGEAKGIKEEMLKMINAEAGDAALQKYRDIFRRHPDRIFQWADDRRVPAENNMSERGVRRTVIARKVCGGSQSEAALSVRETLQPVICSLKLRHKDPVAVLTAALDERARNPDAKLEDILFPLPDAKPAADKEKVA